MSVPLSVLAMPQTYNSDDALPPLILDMYGNDSLNDCVIVARAHHTIRLAWDGVRPLLNVSDSDVRHEYFKETGGPDDGLSLKDSLDEWRDVGWTIGIDPTMRKIKSYSGPYGIEGGAYPVDDPAMVLNREQLHDRIFAGIGAHVNLILPNGVSVRKSDSFGPAHPWQDTSGSEGDPHVMLLTGYSADDFLGITWAQRQKMTWGFLQHHCWGVFFVQKGNAT